MLPQLWYRQSAFDLVDAVVFRGRFNHLNRLSIGEDDGLRDFEMQAAHVGAFRSAGKFLDQPVVVLLLVSEVVTFIELYGLILRDTVHFYHNALFDCVIRLSFLLLNIVAVLCYLFV